MPHKPGGFVVVVVDDERPIGELVARMLTARGFETVVFTDPAEAVAHVLAGGAKVDALVSDVELGSTTGPAIAKEIRHARGSLPVVFMSGSRKPELGSHMAFLEKPFSIDELIEAVDEAMSWRRSAA